MRPVGMDEMAAVFEVTDGLGLSREAVRVPLRRHPTGTVRVESAKLVIELPPEPELAAWIGRLRAELEALDLGSVPRE